MRAAILCASIALVACAVDAQDPDPARESVSSQGLCTMDDDGVWTCGDQPGGGGGSGGGGGTGFACMADVCDPSLPGSNSTCVLRCGSPTAYCARNTRCPTFDPCDTPTIPGWCTPY